MQASQNRRERERLMRHNAILESAQIEFAEKGYARAKLEDIARRAEFGKGTLYNYFPEGKQGMLFAIFDGLFDETETVINESFSEEIMQKKSFRDAFYDFTLSCLTFYIDRKELFLILVKEAHRMCFGENQEHASYFRDQQLRLIAAMTKPIQRAMEAGHLRKMDPQAVAHMILGNIQGIQVHVILEQDEKQPGDEDFSPEQASRFLTTFLLDGLANFKHNHPIEAPDEVGASPVSSHA